MYHKDVTEALAALDESRRLILASAQDAQWTADLLARYPHIQVGHTMVQCTGCIAITCFPERLNDMVPLLREMRERHPEGSYRVHECPSEGCMRYYIKDWYIQAILNKSCAFKQVGKELVEKPVYELVCE